MYSCQKSITVEIQVDADAAQNKKLKTDERLKTLNLLASLAPSAEISAALASTGSLFQNPSAPTSAIDRQGWREDRVVRKGIEKLKNKTGDMSGSGSEGSEDESGTEDQEGVGMEEEQEGRRKGRPLEVVTEIGREEQLLQRAEPIKIPQSQGESRAEGGKAKKSKKRSKKVSWLEHRDETEN